jgi:hypothetical protein
MLVATFAHPLARIDAICVAQLGVVDVCMVGTNAFVYQNVQSSVGSIVSSL